MLLSGLGTLPWGNWSAILNVGLLIAVLGSFYGAIAALDSASGMSSADHPFLRTALCGILGATSVLLVEAWPPHTFNVVGPLPGCSLVLFSGGWNGAGRGM